MRPPYRRLGVDGVSAWGLLGLLADDASAGGRILRAAGAGFYVALRMGFLGDLRVPFPEENVRFALRAFSGASPHTVR